MIFFILARTYKENILIFQITLYIIFYVTRRTIHFKLRTQKIPCSSPPSSPPFIPFQIINHRCANSCIYQRSKVVSLPRLAQTNYNWGWWKGARRGGMKIPRRRRRIQLRSSELLAEDARRGSFIKFARYAPHQRQGRWFIKLRPGWNRGCAARKEESINGGFDVTRRRLLRMGRGGGGGGEIPSKKTKLLKFATYTFIFCPRARDGSFR